MDLLARFRSNPSAAKLDTTLGFYVSPQGHIQPIKSDGAVPVGYGRGIGQGSAPITATPEGYAYASIVSVWAMRCIEIRASIVQRMGWMVVDRKTRTRIPDHPLMVAVKRSHQRLFRLHERAHLTWGETFLWPRRNGAGYSSDLTWLNNLYMDVDTSTGYIRAFRYMPQMGSQQFEIKPNRMAFIKTDNPFDDLRGLSKFESILLEVGIDKDIARTTRAFYANDTRIGLMLMLKSEWSDVQKKEFIDFWKANYQGPKNAGKPVLLPQQIGDIKEAQRAPTVDDVDLRESVRREICAAFGVPLSIAGAWDDAQYQSAPEQRKSLYEETIIPRCDEIKADWNDFVLPFFDDSGAVELDYDKDVVLALTENAKDKVDVANSKLAAGGITLNDYLVEIGQKPIGAPGDVRYIPSGVTITPADQLIKPAAPPAQPPPQVTVEKPETPMLPAPQADKAVTGEVAIMLDVSQSADLLGLQNKLKRDFPDAEWNDPTSFHVTLAYAPMVDEKLIAALQPILAGVVQNAAVTPLQVGSLHSFDSLGKHALHFRIRRNADLNTLQKAVYDALRSAGVELSAYSEPTAYIPHITMGYLADKPRAVTFNSKLTVTPTALIVAKDKETICRFDLGQTAQPIHDAALDELRAWEKKVANGHGAKGFQTYLIRPSIADPVKAAIQANDKAAIKAAFVLAREQVQAKAVDNVHSAFTSAFRAVLDDAMAGNVPRVRFGNILRQLIRTYGFRAYVAGLQDAGVDDEPDEAEQDEIADMVRSQSEYVSGLGDALYKDDTVTSAMADQKPDQWWNKSLQPFYTAGVVSGNRNQLQLFDGPDGAESCTTCQKLKGQVHRAKDWKRKQLRPREDTDNFECGGWECEHDLIPVVGKAVGSWLN